MTAQQQAQAWKWLKAQVAQIQDTTLRNAIMAEFRKRALRDWGYCPDIARGISKNQPVELDDWEKEFLEDIKMAQMADVDTREEKREKEIREAKNRMCDFIESGGKLSDIPEDVRTPFITNLYYEALIQVGDWYIDQADRTLKENK